MPWCLSQQQLLVDSSAQVKVPEMSGQDNADELRTLNVVVPETVYWHVRKCAIESRLSVKDFMALFCQEARPYPIGRVEEHQGQAHPVSSPEHENESVECSEPISGEES